MLVKLAIEGNCRDHLVTFSAINILNEFIHTVYIYARRANIYSDNV